MSTPRNIPLTGFIFDIQRFSIHDGPGIRTTVFLKGCPLRCLWCHNPESQDPHGELSFQPDLCIGCGYCLRTCPHGCHRTDEAGRHVLDRTACVRCGRCAAECYAGALAFIGRSCTVEQVLADVMRDRPFYETSGGGMTLSGGEPLMQFAFTRGLLAAARAADIHTCIETCGFAPAAHVEAIAPLTDLFYFDCKETDPAQHEAFTGVPLAPIIDNLARLDRLGARIVLRCPLVPGLNDRDGHLHAIAELANRHPHVEAVHLLPYHPLGRGKAERLGRIDSLPGTSSPDAAVVDGWLAAVAARTSKPVLRE
jgi:pyruvate formate lyase activating enzyme